MQRGGINLSLSTIYIHFLYSLLPLPLPEKEIFFQPYITLQPLHQCSIGGGFFYAQK
jgi:hypothetical protein